MLDQRSIPPRNLTPRNLQHHSQSLWAIRRRTKAGLTPLLVGSIPDVRYPPNGGAEGGWGQQTASTSITSISFTEDKVQEQLAT